MRVNRNVTKLRRACKQDDNFVPAFPAERVAFIWELTAELWSLKGSEYVERRLPRHVTNLTLPSRLCLVSALPPDLCVVENSRRGKS